MKKSFLKGFVWGAIFVLGTTFIACATNYEALTATFPISINGQKWESEKPVVVINGSTYLPLKAIGEVLNVKVNWNSELNQVEIGESKSDVEKSTSGSSTTNSIVTFGMKNAVGKAKTYLSMMAFSYSGLIEQLEFEGFTTAEATYGADNCGANWNEQAVKKAKSYLGIMSFSRQGLIEQLEFEGFTYEQAVYGVEGVGY